jgi:hypothetical protein
MGVLPGTGPLEEDGGLAPEANVTYREAKSFVEQLNQGLGTEGAFPEGYSSGRFALPTTNQWAEAVNATKLSVLVHDLGPHSEWCSSDDEANPSMASFVAELNRPKFVKASDQASKGALRLVLVP